MHSQEADISVVVPLYNHESFIEAALDSVLQQSLRPREIIVIDDGSADHSFERVRAKYSNEKNLICWTKPNTGAHHTINAGIHRATSSFVAILNSDDMYEPERLQSCIESFENRKDVDVVCTGISFIDAKGSGIRNEWYEQAYDFYTRANDLAISLINGNFLMTTSNFVVRRVAFEQYGYFGNFRYAHDLAFLLRVLAQGGEIHVDPRSLLKYRIHGSNTISEGVLKVKVELAAVAAEYIIKAGMMSSGRFGNDHMDMLYEVLDAHNLSRMLCPVMAAMAESARHKGVDELLADSSFSRFMLSISK